MFESRTLDPVQREVARDVRRGLRAPQKALPSKYFYDERGAELFERICELPEYYVTRTELALLARRAPDVIARTGATELVELGSGSARKARLLLEAMGPGATYVPFDVSAASLRAAAADLARSHPSVHVEPVQGDFLRDLGRIPPARGRRLLAFLGSTIGNLEDTAAERLLRLIGRLLGPDDRLLLGTDLVKAPGILEPAYDDAEGVTAAFNRNALEHVSRVLEGDARPERFEHLAFWNPEASRIEMHLRARASHVIRFAAIDLAVPLRRGETIRTEISRKWTPASVADLLARAGLAPSGWFTDERQWFGLALARPF